MYETNLEYSSTINEVILQVINQRNTNDKKEAVRFKNCKKKKKSGPPKLLCSKSFYILQ